MHDYYSTNEVNPAEYKSLTGIHPEISVHESPKRKTEYNNMPRLITDIR